VHAILEEFAILGLCQARLHAAGAPGRYLALVGPRPGDPTPTAFVQAAAAGELTAEEAGLLAG
jgi:hypothetical protein